MRFSGTGLKLGCAAVLLSVLASPALSAGAVDVSWLSSGPIDAERVAEALNAIAAIPPNEAPAEAASLRAASQGLAGEAQRVVLVVARLRVRFLDAPGRGGQRVSPDRSRRLSGDASMKPQTLLARRVGHPAPTHALASVERASNAVISLRGKDSGSPASHPLCRSHRNRTALVLRPRAPTLTLCASIRYHYHASKQKTRHLI